MIPNLQEVISHAQEKRAPVERVRCVHYLSRVHLSDGGVARAVLDICGGMAAHGHEMTILTADAESVPAAWKSRGANTPRVALTPLPRVFGRVPVEVQRCLAEADVVHLHGPWDWSSLPVARQARRSGIPYVVSTHAMLNEWDIAQKWLKKKIYLALIGRRHLAGAAAVHCTAQAELAQASRYLPPDKGRVVPLPLDLAPFVDLPGPDLALQAFPVLDQEIPRILFLSRLHPMKRPDLLIESVARLKARGQAFRLILAGPGEESYVTYLRRLVSTRGLDEHVLFTGMVSGATKISLFQTATVFVLPTWQENFGYVLFEALAAGVPILTTRRADMWEELQAGGAGIIEPDPDVIATAIQGLLADPRHARELGRKGREWVFRRFGSDRVYEEFAAFYRSVRRAQAVK